MGAWSEFVRPIIETHQPWMIIFFVVFLFVTTFGLLNLLMGTIVDHAITSAREREAETEKLLHEEHKQVVLAIVRLFSLIDRDRNGAISASEIAAFLNEHDDLGNVLGEEKAILKFKIDYVELMETCQAILVDWSNPDNPDDDGITFEEFVGAAMRLQGTAKSRDLLPVLLGVKSTLARIEGCEQDLRQLHEKVDQGLGQLHEKVDQQGQRLENKLDSILLLLAATVDTTSSPTTSSPTMTS